MSTKTYFRLVCCLVCAGMPLLARLQSQVVLTGTPLPLVLIDTKGASIPREGKMMAEMKVIYKGAGQMNHPDDPANEYDGFIGIELRGSSSLDLSDKKPYAVETREATGEDRPVALLGMPKESDWVFLAPWADKTFIRDPLAYELARRIMPWAPRTRFVEVLLNGQYQGVYIITERIKRDKNRVNIAKLGPEDNAGDALTGGYIFKLDKTSGTFSDGWSSQFQFVGRYGNPYYQYHYPEADDLSFVQKVYLQNWMARFEDALHNIYWADSLRGYPQYIDVTSFIDFTLINELGKNVDGYKLSTYLHKDRDSRDPRLHAGPVWDFNLAFGNADYCSAASYQEWNFRINSECSVFAFWWPKMWEDRAYRRQLRDRWQSLRAGPFSDAQLTQLVDSLAAVVAPAQARNYQQWDILKRYIWPEPFCCGTYEAHVRYLRDWLIARAHWMDQAMPFFYAGQYHAAQYDKTKIAPNPGRNALTFSYYAPYGQKVTFYIFDAAGRLRETLRDTPESNDEIKDKHWEHQLSPGVYFYEVWFGDQKESTGQFVVVP